MIVNRKDGKWRVTVQLYGESWRAEKLKEMVSELITGSL